MKIVLCYYSCDGFTRSIADYISKSITVELCELIPTKDVPAKGFLKYFLGGMGAVLKKTPQLKQINTKFDDADLVILASPTWAGRMVPSMRSFITNTDLTGKKVALLATSQGPGEGAKTNQSMKALLTSSTLLPEIAVLQKEYPHNITEIEAWAKALEAAVK